jgi:signal transduction histidine kinase
MNFRGVSISSVERRIGGPSLRHGAGLAVAVAIPVAILFYFQFRSISALSQTSTVVLRQLSRDTADAVTQDLQNALAAPQRSLLYNNQYQSVNLMALPNRLMERNLPLIESTFNRALDVAPFVDGCYVWSDATAEHRDDLLSFDRDTRTTVTNPPEAALVVGQFRAMAPAGQAIAFFEASLNGRRTYFLARLYFSSSSSDRMSGFVAVRVDAERLRAKFIPELIAKKLANIAGPTGFPPLSVTVLDNHQRIVFPAGGRAPTQFVDYRNFLVIFFNQFYAPSINTNGATIESWQLRTDFGNQSIPEVVAARARPQRVLMAVLACVMALGVFFVTRASTREVRVARLLELANLRTRIALDLHDDIGSNLTKISILSEVARQQQCVPESTDESLSAIARISRESSAAMSDIVWATNPERDRLFDLLQRMRQHAEDVCVSRGLALSFKSPDEDRTLRLGMDVRRDLFLIFKESINNIARHSRCSHVDVEIATDGPSLSLQVADNGVGFDPFTPVEGAGLVSMRRRATQRNGVCEVRSAPGQGTTVSTVVPL